MINQMIDAHTQKKEIKNEPTGKQKQKRDHNRFRFRCHQTNIIRYSKYINRNVVILL